MKITRLRMQDGTRVDESTILHMEADLRCAFRLNGFETSVDLKAGKIGMHMHCFHIDTTKLGYNVRINRWTVMKCKAGYKRDRNPTWTQREAFNHIVNNVFDYYLVDAKIVSGTYQIRCHMAGRYDHWEMPYATTNGFGLVVPAVLEIVPIKYAEDAVEWHNINAPFIGAVPEFEWTKRRIRALTPFLYRKQKSKRAA